MPPPVHWRSPDGLVERTLIPTEESPGSADGAAAPPPVGTGGGGDNAAVAGLCQEGDTCRLTARPERAPADLDLAAPAVSVWLVEQRAELGQADTELDRLLERCLLTLRPGDVCRARLRLRADRLPGGRGGTDAELTLRLTVLEAAGGRPPAQLTDAERLQHAERDRLRGNQLFAEGRVVDAFHRYRQALALLVYLREEALEEEERPRAAAGRTACRANLAACQLNRRRFEAARAAASRVLDERPDHVRCLYRRGAANLALQELERAGRDLGRVLELEPDNRAAAQQMELLRRRRRELDQHTADYMSKYFQH